MSDRNRSVDSLTARHFWQLTWSYGRDSWLVLLIPVNAVFLYTAAPYTMGRILSGLLVPGRNLTSLIIAFVVAALLGIIANGLGFSAFFRTQAKSMASLQTEALNMLLKRGMAFHNNQVGGKLVSDAIDYPSAYSQLSNALITNILPFLVSILTGLAVIFYSSAILGGLMMVMSVAAIGSGFLQRHKMAPFRKRRIEASKAVTSHLADAIVNVQAVKTFARESDELKTHSILNDKLKRYRSHDWQVFAKDGTKRITLLMVFELMFIFLIIWLVRRDPRILGAGIFAFSYTITLTNRLFDIGNMVRSIEEAFLLAEPMTAALQDKSEIVDRPAAKKLHIDRAVIEFRAVHFHYSDATDKDKVFEDLSLTIQAGERVGLVGPSGGGKSTITKLLLRFEDIQDGIITIDGQNIAAVTQRSLREAIAYVPQESLLFHRTIKDNIAYGNANATDETIELAARQAYAHDFIMALPKGYDTVVGERGVKLSGGQRQRIAIARAILKNAPILVLDEATSALDSESEQYIQEALWGLMENRTAVVIAHRLSTIQRLDRIVVLADGKVVENGSHQQLLKANGLYNRLWQRQSGGFIEE